MSWRLRPSLSYGKCGGEAVFLDLVADRYFVLAADHTRALELALADAGCAPLPVVANLERQGILENCADRTSALQSTVPPPSDDLVGKGRGSIIGVARAALAWRAAARDLRNISLRQLHDELAATEAELALQGEDPAGNDLETIAADFRRLSRFVSLHDRCLAVTIAFVRTARRRGHRVTLVFGVRLHPFHAHCWAQAGSLVLNDRLDVVCAFSPVASW